MHSPQTVPQCLLEEALPWTGTVLRGMANAAKLHLPETGLTAFASLPLHDSEGEKGKRL